VTVKLVVWTLAPDTDGVAVTTIVDVPGFA
jgi:hypothetical protein